MEFRVTYPFWAWFELFLLSCGGLVPEDNLEDKIAITPHLHHLLGSRAHPLPGSTSSRVSNAWKVLKFV